MNILNDVIITYTGRDAAGNPCHGTITVTPDDQPPRTGIDTAAATAGETIEIDVLANDADPDGGPLTLLDATAGTGRVRVTADNMLSYTAPAEADTDIVTYRVGDAGGNVSTGTVTVTVTVPVADRPPLAGADVATVMAGGTVEIDVLANDTDPEGGPLTVTAAAAETGSVSVTGGGMLSYTAPAGFAGQDQITYEVSDAGGNVATGVATVTVEALNLPPEALDDDASVIEGGTITIDVLANDADPEGGPLTVVAAGAAEGSVTIDADGTLTYTAPAGFVGTDTVGYTVRDDAGNTAEGRVTVGVDPLPDAPPVAVDDTAAVATPGGTITIDVLANDVDPEGGPLTLVEALAENGTAEIAEGKLSYTAPEAFSGVDRITYRVRDQAGNVDLGEVAVTVTPVQLVIDEDTAVGDFAVEAGSGEILVTILEPVDYASTHVIETADLAAGPINLVPPRPEGGSGAGSTLGAIPGIWAGDVTHGAIAFTHQWYRGADAIPGATGDSYVVRSEDLVPGLHYVRTAENAAGSRSVSVEALAPNPEAGQAFAERGVRFTAPAKLVRNADLAPADDQRVIFFVSLVPHATGRQGILRQSSIFNGVEIWDGKFQFRVRVGGVDRTTDSRPLTAGARAHFLAAATASGSITTLRLFSRFAGEAGWTEERSDSGSGPVDLTFGGFSVGGRHGGGGHSLNATVYRIACWAGAGIDPDDGGVFANFVKADGTLADPSVSRGLYGTPRVDLFGPAEDYAAGLNRGAAGNFDALEGTFTNA
jgi:hypothetical protein